MDLDLVKSQEGYYNFYYLFFDVKDRSIIVHDFILILVWFYKKYGSVLLLLQEGAENNVMVKANSRQFHLLLWIFEFECHHL